MPVVYELSGETPKAGYGAVAGAGVVSSIVLGIVYAFITAKLPFVYLNPLLTLAYGAGVGVAIYFAARATRVRSPFVLFVAGVVAILPGIYLAWAVNSAVRLSDMGFQNAGFSLSMADLSGFALHMMEVGDWSLFGGKPTGLLLPMFWFLEIILLPFVAGVTASRLLHHQTFCEGCRKWMPAQVEVGRLKAEGFHSLLSRIEELGFSTLRTAEEAAEGANKYIRMDLVSCKSCTKSNYMTMILVEEGKKTSLMHNQAIAYSDVSHVRQHSTKRHKKKPSSSTKPIQRN